MRIRSLLYIAATLSGAGCAAEPYDTAVFACGNTLDCVDGYYCDSISNTCVIGNRADGSVDRLDGTAPADGGRADSTQPADQGPLDQGLVDAAADAARPEASVPDAAAPPPACVDGACCVDGSVVPEGASCQRVKLVCEADACGAGFREALAESTCDGVSPFCDAVFNDVPEQRVQCPPDSVCLDEIGCVEDAICSPPIGCDDDFNGCRPEDADFICIAGACEVPGCGSFPCNTRGPSWSGDTGLFRQLERFEGPDGDSYVFDALTGFSWQDPLGIAPGSWEYAIRACAQLDHAEQTDWRLPDIYELISILKPRTRLDEQSHLPGLTNLPQDFYWASTAAETRGPFVEGAFVVGLGGDGSTLNIPRDDEAGVICVRGARGLQPGERFEQFQNINGLASYQDRWTGLKWQGSPTGLGNFDAATAACADSGWVLPTVHQLATLIDLHNPGQVAWDESAFPNDAKRHYTRTEVTMPDGSSGHMVIDFTNGQIEPDPGATRTKSRCLIP